MADSGSSRSMKERGNDKMETLKTRGKRITIEFWMVKEERKTNNEPRTIIKNQWLSI